MALAFALRLIWALHVGSITWDPDGYVQHARALADGQHPWRWTFEAVRYAEFHKAPLYQVVLSIFTAFPSSFPMSAMVAQGAIAALACVSFYWLGRSLHSPRAGMIAALIHALWVRNILEVHGFWQENLFLPLLVTAFACLAHAIDRNSRAAAWGIAGAVCGIAALSRSSVTYFLLPAAALHVWLSANRALARRQCAWWIGAFALVVAPYVVFVSAHAGRFMLIDTIGTFSLKRGYGAGTEPPLATYMSDPARAPTLGEIARYLTGAIRHDPLAYGAARADLVRLVLKPSGANSIGSISVDSRAGALLAKWTRHLIEDLPYAATLLLAPFGVVLARRRDLGTLLALWVGTYVALLAVTFFAGGRYREPIQMSLTALASVVLAGGWSRPSRRWILAAAATAFALAMLLAVSVPGLLAVRANYGVPSGPIGPPPVDVRVMGRAGVNLLSGHTAMVMVFRAEPSASHPGPVRVAVRLNGRTVDEIAIAGDESRRVTYAIAPGLNYLEFIATAADGSAAVVRVDIEF